MPVEPMPRVVMGADGSVESLTALELAADTALAGVTGLVVVHALESQPPSRPVFGALTRARQMLSAGVDRARTAHPGLRCVQHGRCICTGGYPQLS